MTKRAFDLLGASLALLLLSPLLGGTVHASDAAARSGPDLPHGWPSGPPAAWNTA